MKIKFSNYIWFLVFILLVTLDQTTKFLIKKNFALYQTKHLLPFLSLTYTTNTGIAFGLFQGMNLIFIVVVLFVLIFFLKSSKHLNEEFGKLSNLIMCLILSGGVGNLLDRIFYGEVIDFIDLQWNYKNIWPIFNLADSYVFIGICFITIKMFKKLIIKN
ncbi:MAG: signal peptidase II [Endomicrobia bacterium]|nr:signal peptidase II [Endomicrobiia bacterium]